MKKLLAVMTACAGLAAFAAAPIVTDVTAKQRFPWNGLVDITCRVSGIDETTYADFVVAAMTPNSGNSWDVSHFWIMQNGTRSTGRKVHVNGVYRLLWDAEADLGAVIYSNMVVRVTLKCHRKVRLWDGGPYWAEANIGAEAPWEYGLYFWWGDTVGYKRENNAWVANDGSSSNFQFSSAAAEATSKKGPDVLLSEGWVVSNNNTYVLAPAHDAAQVHWGGEWRMPTYQELQDLNSRCDWTWTTTNGVNGYVVRGRDDYAANSIFLPFAGKGTAASNFSSSSGCYWSSVPESSDDRAYQLQIVSSAHFSNATFRSYGLSVRPVQGLAK